MKQKIMGVVIAAVVFCLVGCSGGAGGGEPAETFEFEGMSAQQIVEYLGAQGLPLYTTIAYTEETDPNELLGRPGEYTSKASFVDESQAGDFDEMNSFMADDPTWEPNYKSYGGTVEVFETEEDCSNRVAYLNSYAGTMFANDEYMYQRENILLRIDYCLTPSQAKEYEVAFMGGDYVDEASEGEGNE